MPEWCGIVLCVGSQRLVLPSLLAFPATTATRSSRHVTRPPHSCRWRHASRVPGLPACACEPQNPCRAAAAPPPCWASPPARMGSNSIAAACRISNAGGRRARSLAHHAGTVAALGKQPGGRSKRHPIRIPMASDGIPMHPSALACRLVQGSAAGYAFTCNRSIQTTHT
jgi:hypothetical protein